MKKRWILLFLFILIPVLSFAQRQSWDIGLWKMVNDTTSIPKNIGDGYYYTIDNRCYIGMGGYLKPVTDQPTGINNPDNVTTITNASGYIAVDTNNVASTHRYVADDTTDIKVLNLREGEFVYLKQLSNTNPNGGGWFVVADSAYLENGGIAFDHPISGKQYVRVSYLNEGIANVKFFGAIGDGSHDDTDNLLKAIKFKNVYFPRTDSYYTVIDTTLYLEISGQHVYGDGEKSIIRQEFVSKDPATATGQIAAIYGTKSVPIRDVIVEKLHFYGTGVINQNGFGFVSSYNSILRDCWFTDIGRKAITLQTDVFNNKVTNIHIYSASKEPNATRSAITIEGTSSSDRDAKRNIINNITIDSITDSVGYVLTISNADSNIVQNIFAKHVIGAYERGINLSGAYGNTIQNVYLDSLTGQMIYLQNGSSYNQFSNINAKYVYGSPAVWLLSGSNNNSFNHLNYLARATGINVSSQNNLIKDCSISNPYSSNSYIINVYDKYNNIINLHSDSCSKFIGLNAQHNIIENSSVDSANVAGISVGSDSNRVVNNRILSLTSAQAYWINGSGNVVTGNMAKNGASVSVSGLSQIFINGNSWDSNIWWNNGKPSVGYHYSGEKVFVKSPDTYGAIGYVCTIAGSTGTWRMFGMLPKSGTSSARATFETNHLDSNEFGFIWRDTDLKKYLIWNGAAWDTLATY